MPDRSEKEILNQLFKEGNEIVTFKVEDESPKLDKEVEPLVEKIEKEVYLNKPVTDDYGAPLVSPPSVQNPIISLPVSKMLYEVGLKQKVEDSMRWLSEWCSRIIKILGGRASFREENK